MIRRLVSTEFWTDDKVVDKFSPEDKYFMLYLLTNPHTTQLGIYKLNIKYAAFETGYSIETIRSLLDRFENHLNVIFYSQSTGEVAIKNYLIHSIIKGGKPVADLLWKEINDVKNKELITMVFEHIKGSDKINQTVRNIIDIYTNKYIKHNEKHNENENDKSYHESSNESYHESFPHPNHTQTTPQNTPIVTIPLMNGEIYPIYQTDINKWQSLYPDVDILQELRKMSGWCDGSPHKRKNPITIQPFIHRWLSEEQGKAKAKAKEQPRTTTTPPKNKFNNYDGRQYEMDDLERKLLGIG